MGTVYDHITDANHQGYADAADGEPLFPDADPDYAAGWWEFHNFTTAAQAFLSTMASRADAN